ncbi:DUF2752 domain-containing protein [Flavobacterium psychrophilum]|uniref:DUF2752 domain-containing protein n=1 Tax=Flavobacterium psychrophilum TaxID=96345 RepID=UPI000A39448A|nr:DUF2752 domain-containing protein [Flavobacterium psychrophilum]EKT4509441.1 DUF2752 domain-containing protein [Flavobacterium psychrophilum]EKT4551501.1 DUF2752 domain-containing protein [Flavobacterium psychrophilum]ELI6454524.1 DUF2752 domain-containing protein [Flavobacterium psychrophilum]ELM3650397.1 DUF2752 domain-containing protein [Flavobacterium psychrophilum]
MFNTTIKYIHSNKIIAIVCFYFLFSTVLKSTSGVDICIPCLWKSIFGVHCLGCGLTTAFISILELNFKNAFKTNWLIFIIVPFGAYYMANDYIKFKKKQNA